MKIYIASSWKNQHAVEMLTAILRNKGHEVLSFVENNYGEGQAPGMGMPFEEWVKTQSADEAFLYDTNGATLSDLVIYIGPSGKDAAAECAMAWAKGITVIGLWAKGEDFGLMRKIFTQWFFRYPELLEYVDDYVHVVEAQNDIERLYKPNPYACFGREPHVMDFDDRDEYLHRKQAYLAWEKEKKKEVQA